MIKISEVRLHQALNKRYLDDIEPILNHARGLLYRNKNTRLLRSLEQSYLTMQLFVNHDISNRVEYSKKKIEADQAKLNFITILEGLNLIEQSKVNERLTVVEMRQDDDEKRLEAVEKRQDKFEEEYRQESKTQNETLNKILEAQNINTDGINKANDRMNNIDMELTKVKDEIKLTQAQIKFLEGRMEELGKQKAKEVDIKSLIPEAQDGEEQFLKSIMKGDVFKPDDLFNEVLEDSLSSFASSMLNVGLSSFKGYQANKDKISDTSVANKLKYTFTKAFTEDLFKLNNKNNIAFAAAEVTLKAVVGIGAIAYQYNKACKLNKQQLERVQRFLNDSKQEILNMLKTPTQEYFDKMITRYEYSYFNNYNREDIVVTGGEFYSYRDTVYKPTMNGIMIKDNITVSCYRNVVRKSTKIEGFEQSFAINDDSRNYYLDIYKCRNYKRVFNYNNFTNADLDKMKLDKLDHYVKTYLALNKRGEFRKCHRAGEGWVGSSPFLNPLYNVTWYTGNAKLLRNKMRYMTTENTDACLNAVIDRRIILHRLQLYVQNTGSEYGKFVLKKFEEKYKYMSLYSPSAEPEVIQKRKEDFDDLLDLYFKLTYEGPCNYEEFVKYLSIPSTQVVETIATKAVKKVLEVAKDGLAASSKETTLLEEAANEVTLPDGSKEKHVVRTTVANLPSKLLHITTDLESMISQSR